MANELCGGAVTNLVIRQTDSVFLEVKGSPRYRDPCFGIHVMEVKPNLAGSCSTGLDGLQEGVDVPRSFGSRS
jgi:hypothetical protein